ncbi:MAG: hypothetical protein LBQ81_14405 [Zoogloeaceae bacterium]|jgi:hypothetical protein|nr:hypothetical protein [Zoogloeaceae bacterium]
MDHRSNDHALDRLLDSLNRFNRQQDEREAQAQENTPERAETPVFPDDDADSRNAALAQPEPAFTFPPEPPYAADEDFDDLPVLTDIVLSPDQTEAADDLDVANAPFTLPADFDDAALVQDMAHLREEVLNSLRIRLDAEMPTLIEATLQGVLPDIVKEIRQGLEDNVHAALRDLLKSR